MNRLSTILLICCFLNSCSNRHDKLVEVKILNCIHSKAQDYSGNPIDILVLLTEVESALQMNGLLNANQKDSYLELFEKVKKGDSEFMSVLVELTNKIDNSFLLTVPSNFTVILYCYEEYVDSVNTYEIDSLFFRQYLLLKKIFELGKTEVKDFEVLVTQIDSKSFSNDLYRLPLVLFIYAEIEAYQLMK